MGTESLNLQTPEKNTETYPRLRSVSKKIGAAMLGMTVTATASLGVMESQANASVNTLDQQPSFIASPANQQGYYQVAPDGTMAAQGAPYFGDTSTIGINKRLNAPVVGLISTPDSGGYWEIASDGGTFNFGDAPFVGSLGNLKLNKPIVAGAATLDGKGLWLVASDGGVFTFGDAAFYGSAGAEPLVSPISNMAATRDGHGYWLVAQDGGVFTYGDAPFYGSGAGKVTPPVMQIAADPHTSGYYIGGPNCYMGFPGPGGYTN